MIGFVHVEIGESPVTAGELSGGHESTSEEIFLLDERVVEENREAGSVEEGDDAGVGGDERARWHVDPEHGGVVAADARLEEVIAALVVEIVEAIAERADQREAVVAGDFADGEFRGGGWWVFSGG